MRTKINTKCVAAAYAGTDERIVEFFDAPTQQGGLICFTRNDDGTLCVNLYRLDEKVTITCPTDNLSKTCLA